MQRPLNAYTPTARGFTLIELIVVIVILGVLASFALPKFMDLRLDAKRSVLKRTSAEVVGAARMANAKCLLTPGCNVSGYGTVVTAPNGTQGRFANGYPVWGTIPGFLGIKEWINVSGFTVVERQLPNVTEFRLTASNDPSNCLVRYYELGSFGSPPWVQVVDTGC